VRPVHGDGHHAVVGDVDQKGLERLGLHRGDDNQSVGFNPYRRSRARGMADYLFVGAALVVCVLLVAWALFG
jgi:hypothetical protein